MIIIVYSATSENTVSLDLGKADYSYYFILKKYLPVLHTLGTVRSVKQPQQQVDQIHAEALADGDCAVFLSFTPPHQTARGLKCPTVCVMAWEFGSIPDEDCGSVDSALDWVAAIRDIGNVITISDYATRVVSRQVGNKVRVVTVPAPVDARINSTENAGAGQIPAGGQAAGFMLSLSATVVDSRECEIDAEKVTVRDSQGEGSGKRGAVWDGREVNWEFVSKGESAGQYLVGFYAEEEWGSWSRTASPQIILPWQVEGEFELELELVGYGENQGRRIDIRVGSCTRSIVLTESMTRYKLNFLLAEGADKVEFSGLIAVPLPGARDHRTLGLGLSKMTLRGAVEMAAVPGEGGADPHPVEPDSSPVTLQLEGTVYTSVFNPEDGRKNWKDMVTAFCWAFRNDAAKTLILKMSHHNKSVFMGDLLLLFSKLHPFNCRIVAIHGFLSNEELADLMAATSFYVNASSAEGQCLPLLEFMAHGIPAIAPDHTAMETYINAENSFIVGSSLAPQAWPIDPRRAYRTTTQRISWDSLRQCFVDSSAMLEEHPARYQEMARAATSSVVNRYSSGKIAHDLAGFLGEVTKKG